MSETLEVDLCVIGAGSAGLSVAAGASQMGARVALIEKHRMGGDCLNYGCVPSKTLLASAHAAHRVAQAGRFGIRVFGHQVDFGQVQARVQEVIAGIAPMDSEERYRGMGVEVIRAAARFVGPREVVAGNRRVRARRLVIATGSSPLLPPVDGLSETPYFTNETIFDNRERPQHLLVIGGGPIGIELAQAHRRLGSEVTVIEMGRVLPKDDPELTAVVAQRLREEGVRLREQCRVLRAAPSPAGVALTLSSPDEGEVSLEGSHLLLAAGRRPNLEGLDLEAAGIARDEDGLRLDARMRTSNRRVYAIGDVAGGLQFTHVAGYHAGLVIRNALFRLPAKLDRRALPWVTYTDPELAHVGLTEAEAREGHRRLQILRWPYAENDRARAEGEMDGFIKVVATGGGRILGASIVGAHAGELLQPWVLAIGNGMKLGKLAGMVAPYPTLGEISKRAAANFFLPKLFSSRTRKLVRLLGAFG